MDDFSEVSSSQLLSGALRALATANEQQAAALHALANVIGKMGLDFSQPSVTAAPKERVIVVGPMTIDTQQRILSAHGKGEHLRGKKMREMLIYLLASNGERYVLRETLAGMLWSNKPVLEAMASVRQELRRLRLFLKEMGCEEHLRLIKEKAMLSATPSTSPRRTRGRAPTAPT